MVAIPKTTVRKSSEVKHDWRVVDASDCILGRLASEIAVLLMGKHRPDYTPHCDVGDFVVVLNADKVVMTGNKLKVRHYTWFTGYTQQRLESYAERLERKPTDLIYMAVKRMLPKSKMGVKMLSKLKVYASNEHPHEAQMPVEFIPKCKPKSTN